MASCGQQPVRKLAVVLWVGGAGQQLWLLLHKLEPVSRALVEVQGVGQMSQQRMSQLQSLRISQQRMSQLWWQQRPWMSQQ
jgi:hypothetical protein